jgi:hypothetical protein
MPKLLAELSLGLRRWLAAWRGAYRSRRAPPGAQLERTLGAADAAAVDFRLMRAGGRGEFEQMARHFGVEPARVPPECLARLRDAERACAQCLDVRRCRRWLAAQGETDAPALFCPNAAVFEEIASGDCGRASSGPTP